VATDTELLRRFTIQKIETMSVNHTMPNGLKSNRQQGKRKFWENIMICIKMGFFLKNWQGWQSKRPLVQTGKPISKGKNYRFWRFFVDNRI